MVSNLRGRLLEHAVDLVREGGPEALSLREIQRRASVSPAAAYRHYRDRDAILFAVGQRASALLGDHIQSSLDALRAPDDGPAAIARLRMGCRAYLDFMAIEPGLFRAVFLTGEKPERLEDPDPESRGTDGRGPFQLLQDCLTDLVTTDVLTADSAPGSDIAVWAATHGMSVLLLDGPLRYLNAPDREAAIDRLLDVVLAGLGA